MYVLGQAPYDTFVPPHKAGDEMLRCAAELVLPVGWLCGHECDLSHMADACWQVVHMDIKSANVLLQDDTCQVAKIADLGVSRYLVEGSLIDFTLRGARPRCNLTLC